MITRVFEQPKDIFGGIAYLRILAILNTYGGNAEIYIQKTDDVVTAVFGGYQSGFSLCVKDNADFSELDSFFSLLGAEVFCDSQTATQLHCTEKTECNIMRFSDCTQLYSVTHSKISDVYDALNYGTDGDIKLPSFDMWYTDFCLRFNHGCAEYALLENSVAVCGFMTETASLITGVAVKPHERGKGEGKKAVMALISAIREKHKNSQIYAAVSDGKIAFYEKCGFVFDSYCAVLKY